MKAFAYFPYSVAKDIPDFQDGEISVKFKMIEGKLDKMRRNPLQPQTERRLSDGALQRQGG